LNYQKVILKYETKRNQTIELNLSNVSSFFGCFLEFWWIEKKQKHTKLKLLFSNQNKSQRNKQTFEWLNERTNELVGWLVGFFEIWLFDWVKKKGELRIEKRIKKRGKVSQITQRPSNQANKQVIGLDRLILVEKKDWTMTKVDIWYFFVDYWLICWLYLVLINWFKERKRWENEAKVDLTLELVQELRERRERKGRWTRERRRWTTNNKRKNKRKKAKNQLIDQHVDLFLFSFWFFWFFWFKWFWNEWKWKRR